MHMNYGEEMKSAWHKRKVLLLCCCQLSFLYSETAKSIIFSGRCLLLAWDYIMIYITI